MEVTGQQRRLLELCAIRVDGVSVDWSLIARQAQDPSGLDDLFCGVITEKSAAATRSRPVLTAGLHRLPALAERVSTELEAASSAGARLVTVLDRDYPPNLHLIPNLPPFLFYRGVTVSSDVMKGRPWRYSWRAGGRTTARPTWSPPLLAAVDTQRLKPARRGSPSAGAG
jgi:hypothetical protein